MIISVALCTYNGQNFLEAQLISIINQTKPVDEIIICDDASTDGTVEILEVYHKKYPMLFQIYKNMNSLGTLKNFERAISLTRGDIIFLSDQDDIWEPEKVAISMEFFNKNKNCKLFFSNGSLIDEKGESLKSTLWEKWNFDEDLQSLWKNNNLAFIDLIKNENKITGATISMHKDIKIKGIPIKVPYGYWHDAWFGIHASALNGLYFSNKCLIKYRIHKKQQVGLSDMLNRTILLKANKDFIEKNDFLRKIKKFYPEKSYLLSQENWKQKLTKFLYYNKKN